MKNKGLLITAVIFFVTVNTTYYWEGKLGLYAFPAFLILVAIFLGLGIALIRQICFLVIEKFADPKRLINIGVLAIVLALTFLRPFGLIDFDKLEGDDVLVAEREGAANCMTTLKLKDDFTFSERSVCFGISETKGNYRLQNDTIYFDNVSIGRHESGFYEFAVINPSKRENSKILGDLVRYKEVTDTKGHELWIIKNDLHQLKSKKPNR